MTQPILSAATRTFKGAYPYFQKLLGSDLVTKKVAPIFSTLKSHKNIAVSLVTTYYSESLLYGAISYIGLEVLDQTSNILFLSAVKNKNILIMKYFLKLGFDLKNKNPFLPDPLLVAVETKSLDSVECLLEHGSPINDENQDEVLDLIFKKWNIHENNKERIEKIVLSLISRDCTVTNLKSLQKSIANFPNLSKVLFWRAIANNDRPLINLFKDPSTCGFANYLFNTVSDFSKNCINLRPLLEKRAYSSEESPEMGRFLASLKLIRQIKVDGRLKGKELIDTIVSLSKELGIPLFVQLNAPGCRVSPFFQLNAPDGRVSHDNTLKNAYLFRLEVNLNQAIEVIKKTKKGHIREPYSFDLCLIHELIHLRNFLSFVKDNKFNNLEFMNQRFKQRKDFWNNEEERETILETNAYERALGIKERIFQECAPISADEFLSLPKSNQEKRDQLITYMRAGLDEDMQILMKTMSAKEILLTFDTADEYHRPLHSFSLPKNWEGRMSQEDIDYYKQHPKQRKECVIS